MSGPLAAVVTGVGSGIGAAVVHALLEATAAPARVVGIDLIFPHDMVYDGRFRPVVADLRRTDEVSRAAAAASAWLDSGITTLVQCAGVNRAVPLPDCHEDDWADIFAVNVRAASSPHRPSSSCAPQPPRR